MSRQDQLVEKLAEAEAQIASHPLSAAPVKDAFAVIEKHGKENSEDISRELSERNLPSLDELGKIQAANMFSWWRLNHTRRSLLKKIGHKDDRG